MNYLASTLRVFRNTDIKVLGRWTTNSEHIKTKVHQANHDHCGVCDIVYLRANTTQVVLPIEVTDISKSKYMTTVKLKERESAKKLM
jgi:hypothetical protein